MLIEILVLKIKLLFVRSYELLFYPVMLDGIQFTLYSVIRKVIRLAQKNKCSSKNPTKINLYTEIHYQRAFHPVFV